MPPIAMGGFALAIVVVLLIALITDLSLTSGARTGERFAHTQDVMREVEGLTTCLTDAETGQRGFMLTGDETYLQPYTDAAPELKARYAALHELTADDPQQQARLTRLEALSAEKMDEMSETIALRRGGNRDQALAIVRTDRGKGAMDRFRAVAAEMTSAEQTALAMRQEDWRRASRLSSSVTWGGAGVMLSLTAIAVWMTSNQYRAREREAWLRAGRAEFGVRVLGEQRLEALGRTTIDFLVDYLGAQVGALYLVEEPQRFRRLAGYALADENEREFERRGGLHAECADDDRMLHVKDVPAGYLPITSSLGQSTPRELVVAPASIDGEVQAVLELGFFRQLDATDLELLARLSEALGVAVRRSRDRTRLEEYLEETQRQSEELQTQQEELRVNNEELEEQSRALKETHARLECQHAELESTNTQLEEQTHLLEHQKDELSRAQEVLAHKAAELERANHYKSEFLANMSHELRTPLNSALLLSRLLADNGPGNLTTEQIEYAETIHSAGSDLLALINDILDLSRIEAGRVELEFVPVTMAKTIESLAKICQPLAQDKGLEFKVTMAPGAPERIESDPRRLGQILTNLLTNALKFTDRGRVELRVVAADKKRVAFEVHDTGIGIPESQQSIIFEAFRQVDGSTQRRYGGTGLGLYIAQDLAHLLGGEITLKSAPNEGSVFTLTLPIIHAGRAVTTKRKVTAARERVAALSDAPREVRTTRNGRASVSPLPAPIEMADDRDDLTAESRTILVVEDDTRFAMIVRDLARQLGFQCVVTHTAEDGLLAANAYKPSAIVLDINLPDHSGLGVLDQLKRNSTTRHIPVHVVSVADYTQEALELGAVGFALKPVKREELVEAFKRLEAKFTQRLRRLLIVEDDTAQREEIHKLLASEDVQITGVRSAAEALAQLKNAPFDCVVMDLSLPDLSGYRLLEKMAEQDEVSFPPVIVYTDRVLSSEEEQELRRFAKTIIIKDVRSPERLLDEVTLFLHQVEANLPPERRQMLKLARERDVALEGRRILVVEDDVRNVFALSKVLEPKGMRVEIARNGREAIETLTRKMPNPAAAIDLVLMDIMMPEMDGLTAMREIRKRKEWNKLPIIALTAKAMRDDQEQCLAAGANDYVAKPLDVEKLMSLIRVWMPK